MQCPVAGPPQTHFGTVKLECSNLLSVGTWPGPAAIRPTIAIHPDQGPRRTPRPVGALWAVCRQNGQKRCRVRTLPRRPPCRKACSSSPCVYRTEGPG